jgi:hypothetical protein
MVGSAFAGDAGNRSVVAEAMRAGPLGRPISAGSMLRPASVAQGAAPCANAGGVIGPTHTVARVAEAMAASVLAMRGAAGIVLENLIIIDPLNS